MTMLLRRQMMQKAGGELYPVGTGIITAYIRDTGIGWQPDTQISSTTGELYENSGTTASEAYIPINPAYGYEKKRIQTSRGLL